jgi:hypothetical protein
MKHEIMICDVEVVQHLKFSFQRFPSLWDAYETRTLKTNT